jgi:CBS domain containing-hemolysin-like protein
VAAAVTSPPAIVALATGALLVASCLAVLAALLERSGPIRLRHWSEEAGKALQKLYGRTSRFEAYRFVLTVSARLAFAAFFGLMVGALLRLDVPHPLPIAFGVLAFAVAGVEVANRHIAGRHAEIALRGLTPLFKLTHALSRPLLPLVAPLLPETIESSDDAPDDEEASRAEIEAFLDVGRREGILEEADETLVRGAMGFGDTQVRSIMTPRIDMACAPVEATPRELAQVALASAHTRIPIYRESVDDILGILHVRDLLRVLLGEDPRPLADVVQPAHVVPETKALPQLLRELKERHQEVAIVVDEYGGTVGMVTIEDLLEEVFGDFGDRGEGIDPERQRLPDGGWRLPARTHVDELEPLFGVRLGDAEWETVGGVVFGLLGQVPRAGDSVMTHGLRFVVESADLRRARWVRVEPVREPSEEGGDVE